jgi:hypothetical protein
VDMDFAGLVLDVPKAWSDLTDNLEPGSPPTLAPDHGFGFLQFTVATYVSGKKPNIGLDNLKYFFNNYCEQLSSEGLPIGDLKT